jgi:hypothetical protein
MRYIISCELDTPIRCFEITVQDQDLCCNRLIDHITPKCKQHPHLTCPDIVIEPSLRYDFKKIEWVINHPDLISAYKIKFCPFCGKKL